MKKFYILLFAFIMYYSMALGQEKSESRMLPTWNCETNFNALEAVGKGRKEAKHTYYLAGLLYEGCASKYVEKKDIYMIYHMEDGKILKKVSYLESGQTLKESNYQDGRLHGEVTTYSQNGQKFLVERYYQGLPHGTTRRYYPTGDLSREAEFRFGELIREVVFNKDGSVRSAFPDIAEY